MRQNLSHKLKHKGINNFTVKYRASITPPEEEKLDIACFSKEWTHATIQHSAVFHGMVFLCSPGSWLGQNKLAVTQLSSARALAGVHLVSLPSFSQPRDKVCWGGVCCCQQQHLRRGGCLQLQSGRYGSNPWCKVAPCASGRAQTEGWCPVQSCRLVLDHVFITFHSSWREEFPHGFAFSIKGLINKGSLRAALLLHMPAPVCMLIFSASSLSSYRIVCGKSHFAGGKV